MEKTYFCIDLKSFYASVECAERHLDPMKTNLVVADSSRGEGTICLAVSPSMKKLGVKNRCRIFEIPKSISYIKAKPRMRLYMQKSADIYGVYLKFFSKDDIHIYSIDECFIDVTSYLPLYNMSPDDLCIKVVCEVLKETKIPASAGIGTNMFLAKVALDILAKQSPDSIAFLDEELFKQKLWNHTPLTDFWNIGPNIAKRLEKLGINTMKDLSHTNEKLLYKTFGINAEFLIDHSKGIEACTIQDIKTYKGKNHSLGSSQVLFEDYTFEKAKIVLEEMCESLVLELIDKDLVASGASLHISYSRILKEKSTGKSLAFGFYTNSFEKIKRQIFALYNETTKTNLPIRKISISLNNLADESFLNYGFLDDKTKLKKEVNMHKSIIKIKEKYGKNSILKGISHLSGACAKQRNTQIGGHNE